MGLIRVIWHTDFNRSTMLADGEKWLASMHWYQEPTTRWLKIYRIILLQTHFFHRIFSPDLVWFDKGLGEWFVWRVKISPPFASCWLVHPNQGFLEFCWGPLPRFRRSEAKAQHAKKKSPQKHQSLRPPPVISTSCNSSSIQSSPQLNQNGRRSLRWCDRYRSW